MKKITPIIFMLLITISIFGQKNEILTSAGFSFINKDKTIKLSYDRYMHKGIGISIGLRNQSYIHLETIKSGSAKVQPSQIISYHYDGEKFDITPFLSPINNNKFKLKIGAGIDVGLANYREAKNYISKLKYEDDHGRLHYARYEDFFLCEFGYHFIIQSNYYFSNNLFASGHVMYGEVFRSYDLKPEDHFRSLYQSNYFNLAFGIGYRF